MKVYICDLKINRSKKNGLVYCNARNHVTGELLISADLSYIMKAVKERRWELINADEILEKVSQFNMYHKD